jgi:hypothetical protein
MGDKETVQSIEVLRSFRLPKSFFICFWAFTKISGFCKWQVLRRHRWAIKKRSDRLRSCEVFVYLNHFSYAFGNSLFCEWQVLRRHRWAIKKRSNRLRSCEVFVYLNHFSYAFGNSLKSVTSANGKSLGVIDGR